MTITQQGKDFTITLSDGSVYKISELANQAPKSLLLVEGVSSNVILATKPEFNLIYLTQ